jgi:mannonate dehydratase
MRITKVRAIITAPESLGLVIVRVDTDVPGLYGLGCGTFTWRCTLVAQAVDEYLDPLLRGRDPSNIEDLWNLMTVNSYWRNGPTLNNAISGVDIALWDLAGKAAGKPVYELLGGKCRPAAMFYRHADGRDPQEVLDNVLRYQSEGALVVRCQMGGYGGAYQPAWDGDFPGNYYNPDAYARSVPKLFDYIRGKIGFDLHLLHDVHERLAPIDAMRLAKELEPYRLFFLEDPLAPEQVEWFRRLRAVSATPIAMGEQHINPVEWRPLIVEQLIDFVRAHITSIGGLTPARKMAALAEAYGVRTAWQGPGDVSPIGHAANLHLDLARHNFGVQEVHVWSEQAREVFPGLPELRDGHVWPNGQPGFGVDLDEAKAAKYPLPELTPVQWTQARWPDGTIWTP